MAAWDNTLPPPLLTGYNVQETPRILSTPMDSGPQRKALFSAHPRIYGSLSMVVDKTQAQAFNAMFEAARLGSSWITGCPIDTGTGLTTHRIRIASVSRMVLLPPDVTWKISINFETDERIDA